LALLQQRGVAVQIIEYLNDPPDPKQLLELAATLKQPLTDLVRSSDADQDLSGFSTSQLAEYMANNPKVIQRPIVVVGDQARIGRPPERILEMLE